MLHFGKSINKDILPEILKKGEIFIEELLFNGRSKDAERFTEDYVNRIPKMEYYLIYNRYVIIGKRKIDKRIAVRVTWTELISELDDSWDIGIELNYVLLPVDLDLNFGIYIQNSIYYLEDYLLPVPRSVPKK